MTSEFVIPKLTVRRESTITDVPTFKWLDFSSKEELGMGSFGSVYRGQCSNRDNVVVKVLRGQNRESKRLFLKEARLLHSLNGHKNIVSFFSFCEEPYAIMLEYLCFDFAVFGVNKKVTSLGDLLHFIDDQLDVSALKKFQPKIARDIADGLCYLHNNCIVHRDLKPENILVSNQHYSEKLEDSYRNAEFAKNPIICKLSDFGESRATYLQTQTLVQSRTHRANRGTPVYMAPELHLHPANSLNHNDLVKADIWAFGLIMYCLINPDIDHPYQPVFTEAGMSESLDSLKCLLEAKKVLPQRSKYEFLLVSEWWQVEAAYQACAKFDPDERPTAAELSSILSVQQPEGSLNVVPLNVSQATALSNVDSFLAERVKGNRASNGVQTTDELCSLLDNDGTNACVFLDLGICDRFLSTDHCITWTELKSVAENVITEFPLLINQFRNKDETYEPIRAYSILKDNNLINEYTLSEEFVEPERQTVFSIFGRQHLTNVILKQANATCAIGLYTCDPYSLLIGVHRDAFFVIDTHQISETLGGNTNGILLYTDDKTLNSCTRLVQWLLKRLTQSGVNQDGKQSFAWITRGMYHKTECSYSLYKMSMTEFLFCKYL